MKINILHLRIQPMGEMCSVLIRIIHKFVGIIAIFLVTHSRLYGTQTAQIEVLHLRIQPMGEVRPVLIRIIHEFVGIIEIFLVTDSRLYGTQRPENKFNNVLLIIININII